MKCAWKNCANEARENPYKGHEPIYCSKKCKNKATVDSMRHRRKQDAVNYLGGKCSVCGYNKCLGALDFHHVNPDEKDFALSGKTKWEDMKKELDKCVLLCANCHREHHYLETPS